MIKLAKIFFKLKLYDLTEDEIKIVEEIN